MLNFLKLLISVRPIFWFFLVFATILLFFIEMSGVISLSLLIDFLINKENDLVNIDFLFDKFNVEKSILNISLLVVGVSIIRNLYFGFYIYLKAKYAHSISEIISNKIINFFLKEKGSSRNKFSPSYLQHLTVSQSYEVSSSTLIGLVDILSSILVILGICFFLLSVEPEIFISILTFLLCLYLLILIFLYPVLKKTSKDKFETTKKITKSTLEIYENLKEIKILGLKNFFKQNFQIDFFKFNKNRLITKIIGRYPRLIVETFLIIIIVTGLNYFIDIGVNKIVSIAGIFIIGFYRILPYGDTIFTAWANFKISEGLLKFLIQNKLLFKRSLISGKYEKKFYIKDFIKLNIKNAYYIVKNKKIFNNFKITIKNKDKIFITGPSGSGKTTLINIICGINNFDKGEFKINNREIKNISNINSLFSICSQNPIILNRSIKDNIILNQKYDKKRLDFVCKIVNLNKIFSKSRNINSFINPDSLNFSGGEKQRISIARALYYNRQILIMDEATNQLDEISEKNIIRNIKKNYKKRTIIFVSHNKDLNKFFNKKIYLN